MVEDLYKKQTETIKILTDIISINSRQEYIESINTKRLYAEVPLQKYSIIGIQFDVS